MPDRTPSRRADTASVHAAADNGPARAPLQRRGRASGHRLAA